MNLYSWRDIQVQIYIVQIYNYIYIYISNIYIYVYPSYTDRHLWSVFWLWQLSFLGCQRLVNIHRPHEHCSIIQFLESLNLEQPGVPMGFMGPGSLDIPGGLWEIWRLGWSFTAASGDVPWLEGIFQAIKAVGLQRIQLGGQAKMIMIQWSYGFHLERSLSKWFFLHESLGIMLNYVYAPQNKRLVSFSWKLLEWFWNRPICPACSMTWKLSGPLPTRQHVVQLCLACFLLVRRHPRK